MRKKRIMVIGPTSCGKTTLVHALNEEVRSVKKTQNLIYGKHTIDVPGSYIENAWMYKYLISAVQDASCVLVLMDQANCKAVYSPGFAKVFPCPVIGVITKSDLAHENEESCIRQLKNIGILEPYFKVSVPNGIGIDDLKQFLFQTNKRDHYENFN